MLLCYVPDFGRLGVGLDQHRSVVVHLLLPVKLPAFAAAEGGKGETSGHKLAAITVCIGSTGVAHGRCAFLFFELLH